MITRVNKFRHPSNIPPRPADWDPYDATKPYPPEKSPREKYLEKLQSTDYNQYAEEYLWEKEMSRQRLEAVLSTVRRNKEYVKSNNIEPEETKMKQHTSDNTVTLILKRPSGTSMIMACLWLAVFGIAAIASAHISVRDDWDRPYPFFSVILCFVVGAFRQMFGSNDVGSHIYTGQHNFGRYLRRVCLVMFVSIASGIYQKLNLLDGEYANTTALMFMMLPMAAFLSTTLLSYGVYVKYDHNGQSYADAKQIVEFSRQTLAPIVIIMYITATQMDLLFSGGDSYVVSLILITIVTLLGNFTKIENPYKQQT